MSGPDAIRRAQAWLADFEAERNAGDEDYDMKLNRAFAAEGRLAALGPASVALAVALARHMPKHTTHSDWCDEEPCTCGRDALAEWTEACGERP